MFNHTIDFFRFIVNFLEIGKEVEIKNVKWINSTDIGKGGKSVSSKNPSGKEPHGETRK